MDAQVIDNTITGNAGNGVRIDEATTPLNVEFHYNLVTGNGVGNPNGFDFDNGRGTASQPYDIDALNNDWGTSDSVTIEGNIFHVEDDATIGRVNFNTSWQQSDRYRQ